MSALAVAEAGLFNICLRYMKLQYAKYALQTLNSTLNQMLIRLSFKLTEQLKNNNIKVLTGNGISVIIKTY